MRPLPQATRSVAVRLVLVALGGATGIIVARALHPEGRGAYAIVVAIATAAMALGHLSLEQAFVGLWPGRGDALTANGAVLGPLLGTAAAGLAAAGALGLQATREPGLLALGLLAVPAMITGLYLSSALMLSGRVGVVDRSQLLSGVVQCGALLAVAAAGWITVGWVVGLWTLAMAAPLVLLLPATRPRLRCFDAGLARRALSLGARYHTGAVAAYLTQRLDVILLGALASTHAVGLYTVAVTFAELTRIPTDALARAALSRQAAADLGAVAAATVRATRTSVMLAGGSVAALCLTAPVLLPAGYGAEFAGAVPALYALAPGMFALGAARQVSAYLVRLHRPLTMSAPSAVALALNVVAVLVLVPRLGIVGCALASSVSYVLVAAVQIGRFCRASGTPLRRLLPRPAPLRRRVPDPLEDVLVAADPAAARGEVA
ncbi:lipopolysaccharide biosynthesis protein [Dactylosporangium sp. CA-092794]|uniref:lipopolysaccharide biosynthesis protein n=1 Tax=Dactylosporangium sp. CA-092794 TaxID=3239929 RepID=UPI003D8F6077